MTGDSPEPGPEPDDAPAGEGAMSAANASKADPAQYEAASRRGGEAIARLDALARVLRRECPWDREQDARSIVTHTVEEAYELADAVECGDDAAQIDELGDVLFQVHFLALLLEERGAGDLAAVAESCREKLIRRHPHVFGEAAAADASEVLANWDRIKSQVEGRGGESLFGDIPENLPALLYARKAQRRAASRGNPPGAAEPGERSRSVRSGDDRMRPGAETVDDAPAEDPAQVAIAAIGEVRALVEAGVDGGPTGAADDRERLHGAIGAALFGLVDIARRSKVDPELALRAEVARYMEDFEARHSE